MTPEARTEAIKGVPHLAPPVATALAWSLGAPLPAIATIAAVFGTACFTLSDFLTSKKREAFRRNLRSVITANLLFSCLLAFMWALLADAITPSPQPTPAKAGANARTTNTAHVRKETRP